MTGLNRCALRQGRFWIGASSPMHSLNELITSEKWTSRGLPANMTDRDSISLP